MLVRGSNYVRMDMGKLLFNKKSSPLQTRVYYE